LTGHDDHLLNENAAKYAAQAKEQKKVLVEDSKNILVFQLVVALGCLVHYCCPCNY
jgi:hypothetical protein